MLVGTRRAHAHRRPPRQPPWAPASTTLDEMAKLVVDTAIPGTTLDDMAKVVTGRRWWVAYQPPEPPPPKPPPPPLKPEKPLEALEVPALAAASDARTDDSMALPMLPMLLQPPPYQ